MANISGAKFLVTTFSSVALFVVAGAGAANAACDGSPSPCVKDFAISYPGEKSKDGSTHEITYNRNGGGSLWITAPMYDYVVEVSLAGTAKKFHRLPGDPHGIAFDAAGKLFVGLECNEEVVRLNPENGQIEAHYPVRADPHGLAIGPDGKTVWFTGKTQNTVGKFLPNGALRNFALPTAKAFPIYIAAGPDGNMWFTELAANNIGRVTADGKVTEFPIPTSAAMVASTSACRSISSTTSSSRPIAIVPDPTAKAMWFSEEAGNMVGRIDMDGHIVEFAVPKPKSQPNVILAGLAFDEEGNLWVQQYVDQAHPVPAGPDYVIKIGKSIQRASPDEPLDFTSYEVPTRQTVMHRIIKGPDNNMWFTELKADRVGVVNVEGAATMK